MKELIELVKAFFKAFNLPTTYLNLIVFALLLTSFVFTLLLKSWSAIKKVILWRNQRILNRDLQHFYSFSDVYSRTKYYIKPNYQNVAPSEDDEPGRRYIASAKNDLIKLFMKKVFPFGKNDNKHFIVLADSGMGKTAFLINLYITYKNSFTTVFSAKKYDIKLFPVWHKDSFNYIEKISDPGNTILLLDAFDEDIEACKNYAVRLNEIIDKTNKFRLIILTSRTQFFPSQKEEPHETGYFTGGDNGEYKFQKIYLSVFDDKDVNMYLLKKFNIIFQLKKFLKAKKLIRKCPSLVVRPMLLSFVNDLIKSDLDFRFSFQIYQEMIFYWLIREAKKTGIVEKFGSEAIFQNKLLTFSQKLAVYIYSKREVTQGFSLPINDNFQTAYFTLADIDEADNFTTQEIRSKSLLNRNAVGEYKFSHKSILEYFLAKELFNNSDFLFNFNFHGMDAAKSFFHEMVLDQLKLLDGEFKIKDDYVLISKLSLHHFQDVYHLSIFYLKDFRPESFSAFRNLRTLLINDFKHRYLYRLYEVIYNYNPIIRKQKLIELNWIEDIFDNEELMELWAIRKPQTWEEKRNLTVTLNKILEPTIYVETNTNKTNTTTLHLLRKEERRLESSFSHSPLNSIEQSKLDKLRSEIVEEEIKLLLFLTKWSYLDEFRQWTSKVKMKDPQTIKQIDEMKNYLNDFKRLGKMLPNCVIFY